jgi:hypothetical protein
LSPSITGPVSSITVALVTVAVPPDRQVRERGRALEKEIPGAVDGAGKAVAAAIELQRTGLNLHRAGAAEDRIAVDL